MKKFSITKNPGQEKSLGDKARIIEGKDTFDFRQIQFEDLRANEKNFYAITNIEELAESIKEFGLLHNITVLEIIEDEQKYYKILSGERRYRAVKLLREKGEKFDLIPCKVIKELSEIEEELILLKGNSDTRELSQDEKRRQVEKLKELYTQKGAINGEIISKTEIKENIANDVGISPKQVERYDGINENLIPALKEYFDNQKISFNEAVKFSRLTEEMQLVVLSLLEQKDKVSNEEIEVIKQENKKLVEENKNKDKELSDKEKELREKEECIETLKSEKEDIEQEKEALQLEQEDIEETKKSLEKKIREEISTLTTEEIEKYKEELETAKEREVENNKNKEELERRIKEKELELKQTQEELNKSRTENTLPDTEPKVDPAELENQIREKARLEKCKYINDRIIDDIEELSKHGKASEQAKEDVLKYLNEISNMIEKNMVKLAK